MTATQSTLAAWQPYCGAAPHPAQWLAHWNWDPFVLGAVILLVIAGLRASQPSSRGLFAAAGLIFALFVSPLCALGSALFLARSSHHLVLVIGLAPLLAAAGGRRFSVPLSLTAVTIGMAVIFWAWHVPALYERALSNDLVFWAMQASITLAAAVWWRLLRGAAVLPAAAALLAQMVQMGLLGALLVFAGRPLYPPHWLSTGAWGLTPLEDQQIAGLVMWVVGGGVYLLLASVLIWRALAVPAQTRTA